MASKFKPRIGYKTVAKQGWSSKLRNNAVPVDARFPAYYATVDMRPSTVRSVATDKYYGGPQSEGNIFSNGQGNLIRSYITTTAPNYCENKDGTIKTFASTTAAVRPVLGGLRLNSNHTETLVAPRDFTNAAWVKDAGVTAAKNQTGRTGVANSASSLTWTVDDAVVSAANTRVAAIVTLYMDYKRISGTAPLQFRVSDADAWADVPTGRVRSNGWMRVRVFQDLSATRVDPKVSFRSKNGNAFAVDFVNLTAAERDYDVTAVSGASGRSWPDRYSCQAVDNSPFYNISTQAVQVWFLEFWQRRDVTGVSALFRSDGHMSVTSSTATGITMFGLTLPPAILAPDDGLFDPLYMNRLMFWRTADGNAHACLNGGTVVHGTGAGWVLNAGMTHWDIMTNGAGNAAADGAFSRFWAGISTPTDLFAKNYTRLDNGISLE